MEATLARAARYPLLDALLNRRTRRFAAGNHLAGGPLEYQSGARIQPLTPEEEAALAFAACGITGYALAELPYAADAGSGGGNIMVHFVGRTAPSGDALHSTSVAVINDGGAWLLRRPQDFPRAEIPALIAAAREGKLVDLYERGRVRLSDRRLDVPRQLPYLPNFNRWSANVPGSTYFLPVNELSALTINVLLTAFSEEFGYYALDELNRFAPAGVGKFGRSRGGHLLDDVKTGRLVTVGVLEGWMLEFCAIEQGAILQNLSLMTQALGLGGFIHFAAHPYIWLQTLGFRMEALRLSRTEGMGPVMRTLARWLGRDIEMPTAVALERDGAMLLRPFCPPNHRTMTDAVRAFVEYKHREGSGTFRDGGAATGWRGGARVQRGIPAYSDRAVAATSAYCEYVYNRYGRFPRSYGPFRTVEAYQAHHLDLDFYHRFYRDEALSDTQRAHPHHEGAGGA